MVVFEKDEVEWIDENGTEHRGNLICVHQSLLIEHPVKYNDKLMLPLIPLVDAPPIVVEDNKIVHIPSLWIKFSK